MIKIEQGVNKRKIILRIFSEPLNHYCRGKLVNQYKS